MDPQAAYNNVVNLKQDGIQNTQLAAIVKGSFTGLLGGLLVGWYFKKNLFVTAFCGAAGGALLHKLFETKPDAARLNGGTNT